MPGALWTERQAAFGEVVRRFQDMAYGYAYAALGDPHLAEDAVQEAFVAAWHRLDQLREAAAFPGWFRRILRTECRRLTRGKRPAMVSLEQATALPITTPDPQSLV